MCWNADISLNTFLFGCFVLVFIYLTHTYTRYKTPMFENPLVYLFLFSVLSMQLIEYFLWTNLTNKSANRDYSTLGLVLVLLQLFFLMLLVKDVRIRVTLISIYLLFILYISVQPSLRTYLYSTVSKNGHLVWEWMNQSKIKGDIQITNTHLYLLLYLITLLFIDIPLLQWYLFISLFVSIYFYYRNGTFGTMWCWFSNLFLLYFVVNILLIQPFLEYNGLC